MRKIFLFLTLASAVTVTTACSNYDSYRITQTERHKQNYYEDIKAAKNGTLTRIQVESSLQSFDTSMIEEQTKNGEGLEDLKKKLDKDSKNKLEDLFGKE